MNNQTVLNNFLRSKKGASHNTTSTGKELFLHDSLIARHSTMFVEIEKDTLLEYSTRVTVRRVNELLILAGCAENQFRIRNGNVEFKSQLAKWEQVSQALGTSISYKNKWYQS